MPRYSGKVGKGARQLVKERKRDEAQARQETYDAEVLELAKMQNISLREARRVLRSTRNIDNKKEALREQRSTERTER